MRIIFQSLGKQFSHKWALRGISGKIKNGSKIAILGKNGAGKSTLMGILAGFYTPTEGSIQFIGKKDIVFIGHDSMLYSQLTAFENLSFFQTLNPKIQKSEIIHSLHFTDLYAFRNDKVVTFSHGMKKRLNIARAIIQKPSTLILDEAFSGLDLKAKNFLKQIIDYKGLSEINWSLSTLIFVEHEINYSLTCCNEFWLLDEGRSLEKFLINNHSLAFIKNRIIKFLEAP